MKLHELNAPAGARKAVTRKGRGAGSGNGKTAGYGHKGQKARSGAKKAGFEGGQMPIYRRLPKRGFTSLTHRFVEEVRLSDLEALPVEEIDLLVLKNANVVSPLTAEARVILSGAITRKVTIRGLKVTKGAKAAIEAAGGTVIAE